MQDNLHNTAPSSTAVSASSARNFDPIAAQLELETAMADAIDSGDEAAFWALFFKEGIEEERLELIRFNLMYAAFSKPYQFLSLHPSDEEYESFDEEYRYTPNAEIAGTAWLDQENSGIFLYYGEVDGTYRLLLHKRERIEYDGPRNHSFQILSFGEMRTPVSQFRLKVNYTVSGLPRTHDDITYEFQSEHITAQTIESISLEPLTPLDEYSFVIYESFGGIPEKIFESDIGHGTEVLTYASE